MGIIQRGKWHKLPPGIKDTRLQLKTKNQPKHFTAITSAHRDIMKKRKNAQVGSNAISLQRQSWQLIGNFLTT